MADTNFVNGTVIEADWLNDVNDHVYNTDDEYTLFNVKDPVYGATGDGTTDDYIAIQAAITAAAVSGGVVYFPKPAVDYKFGTTLQITDNVKLLGEGVPNFWRATKSPVVLRYTGSTAAIAVTPTAGNGIDSVFIESLEIQGQDAAAGCHGLYLNASAAGSYIENVFVINSTISDFKGHQSYHNGTVFLVDYINSCLMNPTSTSDHLCFIENGQPSQVTFTNSRVFQYTVAKWCVFAETIDDLRFLGGTIAPYNDAAGANGVIANGGLHIYGTHVEGVFDTQTASIGIQYLGSNGAVIAPSLCALFGTGVQIGDGTASSARGWNICGSVGNNNVGVGGYDILITSGGLRSGIISTTGFSNGTPTIVNNRFDIDGVDEVVNTYAGKVQGKIQASAGTAAAPGLSVGDTGDQGLYDVGGGVLGVSAGGVQTAQLRSTDTRFVKKMYPSTPGNAAQSAAALLVVTGVPDNAEGANGDFVLRSDGAAASSTVIYHKEGGTWVPLITA